MTDNRNRNDTIPTREEYRDRVRELYKIKKPVPKKPTRRMRKEDLRVNVQYGKPKLRQMEILNSILDDANRKRTKD